MQEIRKSIYTFTKDMEPVARAKNGEVVKFIIKDCFDGQIKSEKDITTEVDWHHSNPAAGPLYVEGAEVGDVLAVDILDISVADRGFVCTVPKSGT